MAMEGASIPQLKQWGGWKSDTVPQRYIEDNPNAKIKYAKMLNDGLKKSVNNPIIKGISSCEISGGDGGGLKNIINIDKEEDDDDDDDDDGQIKIKEPSRKRQKIFQNCTFNECHFNW